MPHFLIYGDNLVFCGLIGHSIFCNKKTLLSEKYLFQGREQMLRVTTLNSPIPHDISLVNYG